MPAPQTLLQPYAERFSDGTCKNSPTASEVIKDVGAVSSLTGKVILITGATAGLGVETARALHETGAKLYITARNAKKAEQVIKDITSTSSSKIPISIIQLDLSSLKSVRAAAEEFLSKEKTLNILINNAGKLPHT